MQDAKLIQELIYALAEVDLLLVQDTQEDETCRYCGVEWGKHKPRHKQNLSGRSVHIETN